MKPARAGAGESLDSNGDSESWQGSDWSGRSGSSKYEDSSDYAEDWSDFLTMALMRASDALFS